MATVLAHSHITGTRLFCYPSGGLLFYGSRHVIHDTRCCRRCRLPCKFWASPWRWLEECCVLDFRHVLGCCHCRSCACDESLQGLLSHVLWSWATAAVAGTAQRRQLGVALVEGGGGKPEAFTRVGCGVLSSDIQTLSQLVGWFPKVGRWAGAPAGGLRQPSVREMSLKVQDKLKVYSVV